MNIGVDGYVAGFAEGYGYGLVASMQQNGRRVDLAINGLANEKSGWSEARRVLDWAMANFAEKRLFEPNETIAEASVYGGAVRPCRCRSPSRWMCSSRWGWMRSLRGR